MAYPAKITREQVLEAAGRLLEKKGTLEWRALARLLKVQPPSLYRLFPSLQDLQRELARDGFAQLGAALAGASRRPGALVAMASAYRTFGVSHPALYRLMHQVELTVRRESPEGQAVLRPLAQALGLAQTDRTFHAIYRAWWALLHGFVLLEQAGQFERFAGPEEAFTRGLAAFVAPARPARTARGRRGSAP